MRSVLGGVVIAALAAAPALASEMTMPDANYTKSASWFYDWRGFYLGAFSGYTRTKIDNSTTVTNTGAFDSASSLDLNTIPFGAQFGYDYVSPWWHIALGVVADANSGFDHTTTFSPGAGVSYTQETKVSASGTVRARLGYAFNSLLVYGTGGWAWAMPNDTRTQISGKTGNATAGTTESLSPIMTGWTAGGGLAFGFWHNWELFGEYRYVNYGNTSVTYAQAQRTTTITSTASSVLAGVNFRFDPIVGR